jgi:hypothetical protein
MNMLPKAWSGWALRERLMWSLLPLKKIAPRVCVVCLQINGSFVARATPSQPQRRNQNINNSTTATATTATATTATATPPTTTTT